MPALATVKTATPSDELPVIRTIQLAFSADPAARWLYPDPQQYLANFPSFIKAFGGKAFQRGSAYYIDGYSGAALWLPPDAHPDEHSLVTLLQQTVPEQGQGDVFGVLEQMNDYHPRTEHWYLPMIGVDPAHQHKGYGSALMRHALAACDREKKLAYLESSSPKNIPFYERHGFELVGAIQVGSSPPIFPMVREPRAIGKRLAVSPKERKNGYSMPGGLQCR